MSGDLAWIDFLCDGMCFNDTASFSILHEAVEYIRSSVVHRKNMAQTDSIFSSEVSIMTNFSIKMTKYGFTYSEIKLLCDITDKEVTKVDKGNHE